MKARKLVKLTGWVGLALFLAIQLVPVERSNPVVVADLEAPPEVEAVLRTACYDCHSSETRWPWYSYVAPVSWIVEEHTEDGRRHLDFSAWDRKNEDLHEILEVLEEGEMPLPGYLRFHPEAVLDAAEQAALIEGFRATLAADPGGGHN